MEFDIKVPNPDYTRIEALARTAREDLHLSFQIYPYADGSWGIVWLNIGDMLPKVREATLGQAVDKAFTVIDENADKLAVRASKLKGHKFVRLG